MEKRNLYDKNRKLTGETVFKGEIIPPDKYINIVLIFIQNDEGKFLIQKRSQKKNGKYASTGGHPQAGEDSLTGIIREVKEEIGLDLNSNDIKLFFTHRFDEEQIFLDDYYIKTNIEDISKLKLQESEVESINWYTEEEIHKMNQEGKFFINDYEEFIRLLEWLKKNEVLYEKS